MNNRFAIAARLAAVIVLSACQDATPPVAAAGSAGSGNDTQCIGVVTGAHDNIIVPPGASCSVVDAVVRGNIKALQDATLVVFNSEVRGNIDGEKADVVQIRRNQIGGSIQIKEGGPHPVFIDAFVCDNILQGGNIQIEKMVGIIVVGLTPTRPDISAAACRNNGNTLEKGNIKTEDNFIVAGKTQSRGMDIFANNVRQNVQVFKNHGPGVKLVQSNTVGENLQCFENTPLFVGGPNAASKAEGQCFAGAPMTSMVATVSSNADISDHRPY